MTYRPPSNKSYHHGIASYPTEYRGYVVSSEKICIQFNKLQCKTRIDENFIDELRTIPDGWEMGITQIGTDVDFLAVGIPIHLHKVMQMELLKGYEEHIHKWGPEMHEFLIEYHAELGKLLGRIDNVNT